MKARKGTSDVYLIANRKIYTHHVILSQQRKMHSRNMSFKEETFLKPLLKYGKYAIDVEYYQGENSEKGGHFPQGSLSLFP